MSRVALIVPPYHSLTAPALSVSLLKALLRSLGVDADVLYLNLQFQEVSGRDLYALVVQQARALVGDWLFASDLFGDRAPDSDAYIRDVLVGSLGLSSDDVRRLVALRLDRVPAFLARVTHEIVSAGYGIAVTAMDFAVGQDRIQNCPTLAVFRRLKSVAPSVHTVMGGVNCQGAMGSAIHDLFPFVDVVCAGEVERTVPALCASLLAGERPALGPGLLVRGQPPLLPGQESAPLVFNLDALPYPDFDDYFRQFDQANLGPTTRPFLVMETSRGCWWGEKHHCTFCGLNGDGMAYRAKAPQRALDELDFLVTRHGVRSVFANDMILNPRYFDTFLAELAERPRPPALFFETKANLTFAQLGRLAAAGVREIQPGIESFSTPLLRLMDKGVTALQNIRLLKWCRELGIEPFWNILYGFPGEDPAEYQKMADLLPSLLHLHPPRALLRIRMDRFSPNFNEWEARGFAHVRPVDAYAHVYPATPADLARLAYYFAFDHADGRDPESYIGALRAEVHAWNSLEAPALLALHHLDDDTVEIEDTRSTARTDRRQLHGAERRAYLALDAGATAEGVSRLLAQDAPAEATPLDTVQRWLDTWVAARWVYQEGDRYLSLATDATRRIPLPVERLAARLARANGRQAVSEMHPGSGSPEVTTRPTYNNA